MSKESPILILEGSKQPYISLGVYSGGIKAFGYEYIYIHVFDAFIRKDYFKTYNKYMKEWRDWKGFVEFTKSGVKEVPVKEKATKVESFKLEL